jgi:hypothetical protein
MRKINTCVLAVSTLQLIYGGLWPAQEKTEVKKISGRSGSWPAIWVSTQEGEKVIAYLPSNTDQFLPSYFWMVCWSASDLWLAADGVIWLCTSLPFSYSLSTSGSRTSRYFISAIITTKTSLPINFWQLTHTPVRWPAATVNWQDCTYTSARLRNARPNFSYAL